MKIAKDQIDVNCQEGEVYNRLLSLDNKHILELGCGSAEITRNIASAGNEGKYLDAIADELENGAGGENLKKLLGFANDADGWEDALIAINKMLDDGFIKVLAE